MQQIAAWLGKLGLEQYAKLFSDNDIDIAVLPHLSDQDLKDLGVSLGHRRKIFAAINKGIASVQPLAEAERPEEPAIQDAPERRYVTVLFSDLVGSTAISTRLDPEDLRDVIAVYQRCVEETVRRFNGFIAKFMGDGVLVYFGYPEAREDDPEQAVRAGLEVVAAVKGLQTSEPLEARVGIATGLVVVGDLIGSGASQEQAIVGKTPNLAARLQGIASPNMVIIADSTRKLLGNLFEFEDLGGKDLKGIEGPERACAVLRANPVESRFDAFHTTGVTELVGRQEELELLLRRWSKAVTGEGQVVLLSGEPGIGKSRLTAALLERLSTEPHTRLRYFCSPQHTDSALYPIITQMERAAGFAHGDTANAKLEKLDALLSQSFTPPQDRALFAELLSLPNDERYPQLYLTPQQRRQRTFEALTTQIVSLAEQRPVLMIFEDVHWIDPTSLGALGRGIDRVKSVGVLLIITHRTEFEPPWIGRPYVSYLSLNRLGQHEIGAMIDRVTGNRALPESVRQDIIERTDGIPLFVEEMTKAVLEAESEGAAEQAVTTTPSPTIGVPASLHASLMARLDRLGPAKEVAQIGAAIGREFSHALLQVVVAKLDPELQSALDRLVTAGLLFRQGTPPHANYLFKHALVQDVAYGTLLREPRRALHARIAETLESKFAEMADNQPELLARHYTEAGLIEKAAGLWGKAGQRSLERSALVEAAGQLTQALTLIATLPATPALRRQEITLQVALITPLIHVKGYAAPETKVAVERARLLIEQAEAVGDPPEDPLLLFSVLNGFWLANYVAGNGSVICELASQFLALAKRQTAIVPLMIGHRMVGTSLLHTGDLIQARAHLDRAIALYDPAAHRPLATRFGQDVLVITLLRRSMALWTLGYPDAAVADTDHALSDAREIGHAATLLVAFIAPIWTYPNCGNYAAANGPINELVALAKEKDASYWKVFGMLAQASLLALTGKAAEAVPMLTSGLTALRSMGAILHLPWYILSLARAYRELGLFDSAWRCIGEAITTVDTTKERRLEAEVYRTGGEIALKSPEQDSAKAETYFERALTIARRQQAKSWELRAATSRARLWRDQGKVQQARELLAPVYGWFTEGFDTRDLKDAKASGRVGGVRPSNGGRYRSTRKQQERVCKVKISDPKGLSRRELTECLLTFGLAMPTVVTIAGTRTIAAAAPADGTAPNGPERTVKFHDGPVVPALGQGSARLGQGRHPEPVEEEALREGISHGMTLIDTAEIYGNGNAEKLIGHVIAGQREHVFLVSKVWPTHVAGDGIQRACVGSLARLGADYLDLYLLHWPNGITDFSAVVSAFENLRSKGKIRAWGVSNFNVSDMERLLNVPHGDSCATNQVPYSLGDRAIEHDLMPWCGQHAIPIMAYSPLGGASSTLLRDPTLARIGVAHGCSSAAVALAWTIRNGKVIAIPESGNVAHVKENAVALFLALTSEELQALDAAHPVSSR